MRSIRGIQPRTVVGILAFVLAGATGLTGCSTLLAVKGQQRLADTNAVISGTVTTEKPARGPLFVALLARPSTPSADGRDWELVDYFVTAKPGTWVFGVQPGSYYVTAFEDVNGDGAYDDEPLYRPDPTKPLVVTAGQRVGDMKIVIPYAGRALQAGRFPVKQLALRDGEQQKSKSIFALSAVGTPAKLDDRRFAPEVGQTGMWKFYDFLLTGHAGIYFLEPYDPARIPVLFVHGIGGTPRDFTTLIGALDRKRFQPWVLYYPSGGRLDVIVQWADELFTRLEVELGVKKAVVVAHSMGGLVSRGFVLRHHDTSAKDPLVMFVTISSPLGGMASAGDGVEDSPVVIRSWYGLAPGSPYLDGLFYEDLPKNTKRRRLADQVAYHMLFGFKGGGRSGSSDGTVAVSSQLRPEAQDEARTLRGYDATHVGILSDKAAVAHVNALLAEVP